jgi:hypothetical protein
MEYWQCPHPWAIIFLISLLIPDSLVTGGQHIACSPFWGQLTQPKPRVEFDWRAWRLVQPITGASDKYSSGLCRLAAVMSSPLDNRPNNLTPRHLLNSHRLPPSERRTGHLPNLKFPDSAVHCSMELQWRLADRHFDCHIRRRNRSLKLSLQRRRRCIVDS